MSKSIGIFAIIMAGVAFIAFNRPQPAPTVNAADNTTYEESTDFGGPPDQEVAYDAYTLLASDARAYPQLRPMIRAALADDKVTWAEYDRIEKASRPFALKRGEIEEHEGAAPYRKKLADALRDDHQGKAG